MSCNGVKQKIADIQYKAYKQSDTIICYMYLSILVPLQSRCGDGLGFTFQRQGVVDCNLYLFRGQALPRDVILIDLRWN